MVILIISGAIIGQFFLGYGLNKAFGISLINHPRTVPQMEAHAAKEGYVHRVLVAFDEFVNVICFGSPDETISSRVRRISAARPISFNPGVWIAKILNGWLDFIQAKHGFGAQAGDLERATAEVQAEDKTLGV